MEESHVLTAYPATLNVELTSVGILKVTVGFCVSQTNVISSDDELLALSTAVNLMT